MTTALVTGATAGIGRAICEVLAGSGVHLVVVARDRDRLVALAERLGDAHGITCEVLPADLADDADSLSVMGRIADPDRPVDILVNNAGYTLNQPFLGGALDAEERLLAVLVRAVLRLTHAAVPGMVDRGHGTVVNVSSAAGWVPTGTYAAAKSWVTMFTEALATELEGTGVTATALCPGFTRTEFHDRAGMRMSAFPSWAWLDARRVAEEGLRDARRGRVISVPSTRYHVAAVAAQMLPRPVMRAVTRRYLRLRGGSRTAMGHAPDGVRP